MEPLLISPPTPGKGLTAALDEVGYPWVTVATVEEVTSREPDGGWPGAIVDLAADESVGMAMCHTLRDGENRVEPLLAVITLSQLDLVDWNEGLFDDFILTHFEAAEIQARVEHLFWRTGQGRRPELIEYGELMLNTETYQAAIEGRPLDLTYMEYELLKYLASRPGKVFTREILLSQVWGYEYYGGARTVDVHVRRLRAKLGEEHASLIQTVRSVGYRFGQSRWGL